MDVDWRRKAKKPFALIVANLGVRVWRNQKKE